MLDKSSIDQESCPLFVYGTLMFDQILFRLLKRIPTKKKTIVCGFKRFKIKNLMYPTLCFTNETDQVEGFLLIDLSSAEVQILDAYEGAEYEKIKTSCFLGNHRLDAHTYLYKSAFLNEVSSEIWTINDFNKDLSDEFVDGRISY